ncbi:hypothetical protein AB0B45_44895 [Nonomuraea sp. NPDC049152]|uniref:hypothetical protein n=1 Tax=Nonomuraea sp. NPDC049152 TaxID=3154350 RepID=UPI003401F48C
MRRSAPSLPAADGHRIRKYVGAYYAVLGRVDAIVFTGGVGEHDSGVRAMSMACRRPVVRTSLAARSAWTLVATPRYEQMPSGPATGTFDSVAARAEGGAMGGTKEES